jgi:hypothetical protein
MEEALLTNQELAALIVLGGLIAFALVRPGRHKNLRSFGALVSLGKPSILVPLVLYPGWTFAAAAGAARLRPVELRPPEDCDPMARVVGLALVIRLKDAMENPSEER